MKETTLEQEWFAYIKAAAQRRGFVYCADKSVSCATCKPVFAAGAMTFQGRWAHQEACPHYDETIDSPERGDQ